MKQVVLNRRVSLSQVAFGGTKRNDPADHAAQFEIMDRYYALGGNTFDSARVYGDGQSDRGLGQWLKSRRIDRSSVRLVAKGSHPLRTSMYVSRLSPQQIREDLEDALRDMGTDYADVYILHRDDPRLPVEPIMEALNELVVSGKTLAVGASNWTAGRISRANRFALENGLEPFSVSQMHHSLALTTPMQIRDITQTSMNETEAGFYRLTGIPVMAFGAMARGYFHAKLNMRPLKEGPARVYDEIPENGLRAWRLKKLCEQTGWSPAAVLGAYVRDCGLRGIPLCGFSSAAQLEDTLAMEDIHLTRAQVRYLETGAAD